MLGEISLDQIARLVGGKLEQDVDLVDVTRVQPNRVLRFCLNITERNELIRHVGWPRDF